MKAIGIVRRVDGLGRIVLPKELRNTLDINARDGLEIFLDDGTIILKKYMPSCVFCGSTEDLVNYKGKKVCKNCIVALSQLRA
jgi:transcriptional pleiotropic regulator of transition state genes